MSSLKLKCSAAKEVVVNALNTLVLIPYESYADLLYHLQNTSGSEEFVVKRLGAERKAASRNIDEIYRNMETKYQHMKQKEIDFFI